MKVLINFMFCTLLLIGPLAAETKHRSQKAKEHFQKHSREHDVGHNYSSCSCPDRYKMIYQNESSVDFNKNNNDTAIKLDYFDYISGFFNGASGEAFIFSFFENRAIYIPSNVTNKTWVLKTQTFDEYSKNKTRVKELYAIGLKNGIEFDSVTITQEIKEKLRYIIASQSPDYASGDDVYGIALQITQLVRTNRIKYFEHVFDSVESQITGDVHWYMGLIGGLNLFLAPFDNVMEVLREKKVYLGFDKVLESSSGFQLLTYLLTEFAPHVNLSQSLQKNMNSQSWFLEVVSGLSGNICYGYDGFLLIVSKIVKYASEEISERYLTVVLKQYFMNKRVVKTDLQSSWDKSIKEFQSTLQKLKLNIAFETLSKTLQDIEKKKWIIQKINVSAALDIIFKAEYKEESVKKVIDTIVIYF